MDEKKGDKREIRLADIRAIPQPEDDGKMIVEGYAVVFDTPATHWGFTEIIDKNAFNGADMKDVPMKYNHEDGTLIMARTRNNSLVLTVDNKGLFIHAELIDTQSNRDLYKSIQSGLLDKMSFSFTTAKDEWNYDTDTRRVLQIDKLYDVAVVDTPFYDTTSIYARALEELETYKRSMDSTRAGVDGSNGCSNNDKEALEIERFKAELLMNI